MDNVSNKKYKILCIGDSLALPGHGNRFEDTWFCKLQLHFSNYLFASHFKRAITTRVLISEGGGDNVFPGGADCLEFYLPDIIVLQLGIVDCAPRYLKQSSLFSKVLERMPGKLKSLIYGILKKVKKRSAKNADIIPLQFFHYLEVYLKRCQINNVKKVIIIKICTPDERMRVKSLEILEAIKEYNDIIDQMDQTFDIVTVINPLNADLTPDIYDDGYHPNTLGNQLVFEELKKVISLV